MLNQNLIVQEIVDKSDATALQEFLNCALKPQALLAAIAKSKNYTLLPMAATFLAYLSKEDFYPLIAQLVTEDAYPLVEGYLPKTLHKEDVSRACALHQVNYALIPRTSRSRGSYLSAAIQIDDLEPFLSTSPRFVNPKGCKTFIYTTAGAHCAEKIMTHYGFAPKRVEKYQEGAIQTGNKETLLFLAEYKALLEPLCFRLLAYGYGNEKKLDRFLAQCLNEKIIVLSEEGWQMLKARYRPLYNLVANDV